MFICLSTALAGRLADQKMNVFGHHHVADDHPLVTLPNLFQHFHEQIAARGAGQPGLPPVTTKCEEVQIVSAVPALQAPRHNRRLTQPLFSRRDLGHIVEVSDDENPQVSKIARPGPPSAENRQLSQFLFQLPNPLLQELPLRFLLGQRQSFLIRGPGLSCPAKPAVHIGTG